MALKFAARLNLPRNVVGMALDFLTDEPLPDVMQKFITPFVQTLAVRIPAVVLMYAAANNSLLIPSFPLDAGAARYFQFPQAILGILIITETALPFVGGSLVAMFAYCVYRYGFVVSLDGLPILAVAYAYITMPISARSRHLTIRAEQVSHIRMLVGICFFALGLMKILNQELIVGVADQFPAVMNDPVINLFSIGTDAAYRREWWAFGFGMSEILTGVLLAMGVFRRALSLSIAMVFSKLMFLDFGWPEVPHLYFISVLLIISFSRIKGENSNANPWHSRRGKDAGPKPVYQELDGAEAHNEEDEKPIRNVS